MSAEVIPQGAAAARPKGTPPGLGSVMRGEWIKLRTVRSTYITLSLVVVLGVGLGALISWAAGSHYGQKGTPSVFDPTSTGFSGLALGQLAVAVLGALVVTSEYSTGMIRTSLIAVPARGRFLAAKAVVFTAVTLVVGEVTAFIAFFVGQAILSGQHAPYATIGQADVLRAVIGAGLYLAMVGLLSVAVGALVRNTAGSIAILVALVFVVPAILTAALPSSIEQPVIKFWPSEAGRQILIVHRDAHTLPAWAGFGVMALFTFIVAALGTANMVRRDA